MVRLAAHVSNGLETCMIECTDVSGYKGRTACFKRSSGIYTICKMMAASIIL